MQPVLTFGFYIAFFASLQCYCSAFTTSNLQPRRPCSSGRFSDRSMKTKTTTSSSSSSSSLLSFYSDDVLMDRLSLTSSTSLRSLPPQFDNTENDDGENPPLSSSSSPSSSTTSSTSSSWQTKIIQTITSNPKRSIAFSTSQTIAGALLGPFLDTYHSVFGVLQYDHPFTLQLWSMNEYVPALVTTWWVPFLFGLAGFIIGWLYILLDSVFYDTSTTTTTGSNKDVTINGISGSGNDYNNVSNVIPTPMGYSPPVIFVGIAFFTFQYWLSGIMFSYGINRSIILGVMSACAYLGFKKLDDTKSGLITSTATALGGPLIEIGLISLLTDSIGGYHYTDSGETGFFPLWIVPVYFLGGPANGNLARGVWDKLGKVVLVPASADSGGGDDVMSITNEVCRSCNNSRAVPCPNCDGIGYYMTYGREVKCNCCKGRGLVICRQCFSKYGEDPSDIEAIRERMTRMPD